MPTFHYQAWDSEKQPKSGELEAASVQEAIAQVEALGLTLQSIGYAPAVAKQRESYRGHTSSDPARNIVQSTVLRTHLSKLLENGPAVIPALRAYSEELPIGRRRNELCHLIEILERGDAAEAEAAFSELPEYWIPLLSAAVSSSDPGRILQEFIRESRRTDELRRQWRLMLIYPFLMIGSAGAVLVMLSLLVVPIFRDIFAGFDMRLPELTRFNLMVAEWVANGWPYILAVLVLLVVAMVLISSRRRARPRADVPQLLALFGRTTAIARLSRFMADLLEAGLSIPDTLKVSGLLTRRSGLRNAVWRLADELQVNITAANQLQAPPKLATVYHALRSEMPIDSRIRLLREIADAYSERARSRLSWTRGLAEPVTILLIVFVVASVVVSLFLPLVKLVEGLSS